MIQLRSYEFEDKPGNLLDTEIFLSIYNVVYFHTLSSVHTQRNLARHRYLEWYYFVLENIILMQMGLSPILPDKRPEIRKIYFLQYKIILLQISVRG